MAEKVENLRYLIRLQVDLIEGVDPQQVSINEVHEARLTDLIQHVGRGMVFMFEALGPESYVTYHVEDGPDETEGSIPITPDQPMHHFHSFEEWGRWLRDSGA